MRIALVLVAAVLLAGPGASAPAPKFVGKVERVTATDLPRSWRPGCPVGPAQLRLLKISHWDFKGRPHVGELVVRSTEARDVVAVFRKLYAARFPIRRLRRLDVYGGDDDRSMAADNTSGFNCRVVEGTSRWSAHALGLAIDLNPVENPFISGGHVSPPAGRRYLNRSSARPGMAIPNRVVVRAFASIGWSWGGRWHEPLDYQHFTATGG